MLWNTHIFWNLEGYRIALTKPIRKTIPTSFCDNIVNHEIKDYFLKIFIPCSHIDSNK
jgi:hypothetical protein